MKYFYLAVTIKQDRNENIFTERSNPEPAPAFYSYVIKCTENDNIKSVLECVGGLISASICATKNRAAELVNIWNACHRANNQYLFT